MPEAVTPRESLGDFHWCEPFANVHPSTGNSYSIHNDYEQKAIIFFAQGSEVVEASIPENQ
jgi:hypothetical protein